MQDENTHQSDGLPWERIISKTVHDIRSPLSSLRTSLEILRISHPQSESTQKLTGLMNGQIDEIANHLDRLLKDPAGCLQSFPYEPEHS